MHTPYVLNIKKDLNPEVANEKEAENFAYSWLSDEGFCNTGFFGSGRADWIEVGGRFAKMLVGRAIVRYDGSEAIKKICEERAKDSYNYIDTDFEESVNL